MATSFAFPSLPVELVRNILEHAANTDPTTACNLTLVSSVVRQWTDPILFDTVVLSSARSLRAFLVAVANKPADFVRIHVHNLGIFTPGPAQSINRVLYACAGVRNVACGFSLPSFRQAKGLSALQALEQPREQHLLGMACRDGWDASLVGLKVTHLRLHLTSFDSSRPDCPFAFSPGAGQHAGWACLKALPSLTHLAIVYRPSGLTPTIDIIPHLTPLLPSPNGGGLTALQLILVQVVGAKRDMLVADDAVKTLNAAVVATAGPALRIVAEHAPLSAARQWEDAVRAGQSVWEGAEAIVQSRFASLRK